MYIVPVNVMYSQVSGITIWTFSILPSTPCWSFKEWSLDKLQEDEKVGWLMLFSDEIVIKFPWGVGTSLVIQWLRLWAPNTGGLGWIPGQGTRSCMLQLNIQSATAKIQCSQINDKYLKKNSLGSKRFLHWYFMVIW